MMIIKVDVTIMMMNDDSSRITMMNDDDYKSGCDDHDDENV